MRGFLAVFMTMVGCFLVRTARRSLRLLRRVRCLDLCGECLMKSCLIRCCCSGDLFILLVLMSCISSWECLLSVSFPEKSCIFSWLAVFAAPALNMNSVMRWFCVVGFIGSGNVKVRCCSEELLAGDHPLMTRVSVRKWGSYPGLWLVAVSLVGWMSELWSMFIDGRLEKHGEMVLRIMFPCLPKPIFPFLLG